MPIILLLACFCLTIGQGPNEESADQDDAIVLMQGQTHVMKADNTDLNVDWHIKSDLQTKSNISTVVNNADFKVTPKHEIPTVAHTEIAFEVKKADVVGINKMVYVLLCMLAPCGCCGIDRCFMGQCYFGIMKGLSIGGLGIWFLCDYFVCLYVALTQKPELTAAGYDVAFAPDTQIAALIFAIVILLINVYNCYKSRQKYQEQKEALAQLQEQLSAQNQQGAADMPAHHHSLGFIPTRLTSTLRKAGLVSEQPTIPELTATFKEMDKDGNGLLDREELVEALTAMGVDGDAMDSMIKEADTDGDGKISLPEFLVAMKGSDK